MKTDLGTTNRKVSVTAAVASTGSNWIYTGTEMVNYLDLYWDRDGQ